MDVLRELFGPDAPEHALAPWQMAGRAALVYAFGLFVVRAGRRRLFSRMTPFDMVLAVILGSTLSRALNGKAPLLATFAGSLVLVLLHALLAAGSVRWRPLERLVKGRALVLADRGELDETAMRRAAVTTHDVEEAARSHGVREDEVGRAVLERNGTISVLPRR